MQKRISYHINTNQDVYDTNNIIVSQIV